MFKETQVRRRRHLLLPNDIKKVLPGLYSTEETPTVEKLAVFKLFTPMSDFTWYLTEGSPLGSDGQRLPLEQEGKAEDWHFFGYVTRADDSMSEWGYVSLSELETLAHGPMPAVERDLHWESRPMGEILNLQADASLSPEIAAELAQAEAEFEAYPKPCCDEHEIAEITEDLINRG